MILVIICTFLIQFTFADLVVKIQNGKVRGTTFTSPDGQTFYAWRGIPYGQPPVDDLRFMPPLKASPWDGILNATTDGKACYFIGSTSPDSLERHSEDCLFINVYSPEDVTDETTPNRSVLLWIYGGGLQVGSGDFAASDPTAFLEQGIIVVTFNYRLNAFGFLSTQDEVILGNAGFKDQYLALIWIRENIAFFGGNPLEITLMGESAGAWSVGYHIVSPMSRGLFKGAIMQSGNSISNVFNTRSQAKNLAFSLAKKVDLSITDTNSSIEVKNVLLAASAEDIIQYTYELGASFSTVLEVKSDYSFLSEPVYESLEQGNFATVPIIIGHNSEECLVSYSDENAVKTKGEDLDSNSALLVPHMTLKDGVDKKKIGEEIKELYIGKNGSFGEDLAAVLAWNSDERVVRTANKQALLQSKYAPVYFYKLSFYGTPSKGHFLIPGAGKVGHGADVAYLFNISSIHLKTEADFLTRQRMVTLWSNFVKTSNPTPAEDTASDVLQNIVWKATTTDKVQILDIGDNLEVYESEKAKDIQFWDNIWDTYADRPYNTF